MHSTRLVPQALLLHALAFPAAADEPPSIQLDYGARPSWSPDGTRIVYDNDRSQDNSNLWIMPSVPDTLPTQLTFNTATDFSGDWSPDGSQIVFVSNRIEIAFNVFVITYPGGFTSPRTSDVAWSNLQPAWSPDGTQIVFTSTRSGNSDLWVMPSEAGGQETPLTSDPGNEAEPSWSPDGTQIAFVSNRSGNSDIWVMPATGGEPIQLTTDPASDSEPAWSPDGAQIVFTSNRSGNRDLWVMPATGEFATQLTTHPMDDVGPDWSPDGTQIVFASNREFVGYSLWILMLPTAGIHPDEAAAPTIAPLAIDPNPVANGPATIHFELVEPAPVGLNLYGSDGRFVRTLATGNHPAGRHRIEWNARGMASGVYFLRLETGGTTATRKVVVLDR